MSLLGKLESRNVADAVLPSYLLPMMTMAVIDQPAFFFFFFFFRLPFRLPQYPALARSCCCCHQKPQSPAPAPVGRLTSQPASHAPSPPPAPVLRPAAAGVASRCCAWLGRGCWPFRLQSLFPSCATWWCLASCVCVCYRENSIHCMPPDFAVVDDAAVGERVCV